MHANEQKAGLAVIGEIIREGADGFTELSRVVGRDCPLDPVGFQVGH
jgi:hypothetical protein